MAELLDAYPELEGTLIGIAPVFKKLHNPALRRTVARLTSVRQAAAAGGVSPGRMVTELRAAAGQQLSSEDAATAVEGEGTPPRPAWVDTCAVELFDAREVIEAGEHPLPRVMAAVALLEPGQAFAIVTPFIPAPMIDKVRQEGLLAWTERTGPEHFVTYFSPPTAQ